ncbi:glycosyltransferase family 4 protein [Geodermatophilus sp. SYSU D01176]
MRIAVVSQYFWPENFRVNDLVAELCAQGHEVQVLTGRPNYPTGRLFPGYGVIRPIRQSALGAAIRRVPLVPRGDGRAVSLSVNYVSFAASASVLGPLLVRGRIDAILVCGFSPITVVLPAVILGAAKRVPVVLWLQDLWPDTLRAMGLLRRPWLDRLATRLTAWLHRSVDHVLVQSRAFQGSLRRHGVREAAMSYAPNWAEEEFAPIDVPADRPERAQLPEGFILMFAGNLGAAQDLHTVLAAAEATRDLLDLHWVVLGDGSRAGWLTNEVERRGLEETVHLLGRRPVETMPTWFALADAMLVTLQPDPVYEMTIPSKLQAYLACGRPVLAGLDGEGARVVEEARCGLTAPAGDAAALARGARRLHAMPAGERAALGARARQFYLEHFDRKTTIEHIVDTLSAGRR